MDCANVTRISRTSAKRYPPPNEHALYKLRQFRDRNGKLSKVVADMAQRDGNVFFSCFMKQMININAWDANCLFAINAQCLKTPRAVVSDTLFSELYVTRVFSFCFSQLIAKEMPNEHCVSAFR